MNNIDKKSLIEEKAKKYSQDLDRAFGPPKELKQDSNEITDIKEIIRSGEVTYMDFRNIKITENIRRSVEKDDAFEKLKLSIRDNGLLQNLVVEFRQIDSDKYELICVSGHRRLEALKALNEEGELSKEKLEVPMQLIAKNIGSRESKTVLALSENVHRKNLHFIEVADTYQTLFDEGLSLEEIAKRFEKNATTVKRFLKIAKWPESVKRMILNNPEVFPYRYIWDNFVVTNKRDKNMASLLSKKINKEKEAVEEGSEELGPDLNNGQKSKVKINREKKLSAYFQENRVSPSLQKKIREVFEHFGFL